MSAKHTRHVTPTDAPSSLVSGLGFALALSVLSIMALQAPVHAESVASMKAMSTPGLVYLSRTSGLIWSGVCDGSVCNETSPCSLLPEVSTDVAQTACTLVFLAGDYANPNYVVRSTLSESKLAVALSDGVTNLDIAISGSTSVNVTAYPVDQMQKTATSGSVFSIVDASIIFVQGLTTINSRFVITDSFSPNISRGSSVVKVYNSSFSITEASAIPVGSAIFNVSLDTDSDTRTSSFIFQNSSATSSQGINNVVLFQSTAIPVGFVSILQATVTNFKSISQIYGVSASSIVFMDSTITNVGSLQTPTSTTAGMTTDLSNTVVTQTGFGNDGSLTLVTQGIATVYLQQSTLSFVSIYCSDDPLNQASLASFSLTQTDLVDSDLCLIGTPGLVQNSLFSFSSSSVTFSAASSAYTRPLNLTFSDVSILSESMTLKTNVADSTPFMIQGNVRISSASFFTVNGLCLAENARASISWLAAADAIALGAGSLLTADVPVSGSNIWNISAPLHITNIDGGEIGAIDLSNVRLNLVIASPPKKGYYLFYGGITNITSANGPIELMTRIRIQWAATEAPEAKRIYGVGIFSFPVNNTPQEAYASGPISYFTNDIYRFQGAVQPYVSDRWSHSLMTYALPQECPTPGPTFMSSNTSASGFVCNNATRQWVYDGSLSTSTDSVLIPCSHCEVLILGNFTFGTGNAYFKGVEATVIPAQYLLVNEGANPSLQFSIKYSQAPESTWDSTPFAPGFESPDLTKVDVSLMNINQGCKHLTMKSEVDHSNLIAVIKTRFTRKNDCIIPIAVGVSIGLAALLAIVLIIVCCCCCKEKKAGYTKV